MKYVDGIILAAGKSQRAGTFKMALPLGNKTVIERSIEGMSYVCDRIIVVGGYKIEILQKILKDYSNVQIVLNEEFEKDMFTSVKFGLSYINAPAFFLLPGDCPLVGKDVYRNMLMVDADIVVPTYRAKKGHPVFMKNEMISKILEDSTLHSLRDFINKQGYATIEIDDSGIIFDIDTIQDYEKAKYIYEMRYT